MLSAEYFSWWRTFRPNFRWEPVFTNVLGSEFFSDPFFFFVLFCVMSPPFLCHVIFPIFFLFFFAFGLSFFVLVRILSVAMRAHILLFSKSPSQVPIPLAFLCPLSVNCHGLVNFLLLCSVHTPNCLAGLDSLPCNQGTAAPFVGTGVVLTGSRCVFGPTAGKLGHHPLLFPLPLSLFSRPAP